MGKKSKKGVAEGEKAGESQPPPDDAFTQEEIDAIEAVRQGLLEKGVPAEKINHIELVVTTLNSKLRVDSVGNKERTKERNEENKEVNKKMP